MERRWHDWRARRKRLALQTLLEKTAERTGQRHTFGILQVVNDLARRVIEDERRPRKIEIALVQPARTAQPFDGIRDQPALRAKWWLDRLQPRPAVRTGRSPSPLSHRQTAQYTRYWKEKVQNRVDDHAKNPPACSTQRAG